MTAATTRVNAFSVDVEDWFQVAAFDRCIARERWDALPRRVDRNVRRILALLADRRARGTFFVLGWVAERHPELVREIVAGGHELASHGYGHQRVSSMTPEAFRSDGARAKSLLEDLSGVAVAGYRAPSFSIGPSTPWAFDILHELGFSYSSSVYPVRHDHYGTPDAPRFPHASRAGLLEIPPTTLRMAGRNVPAAGGGYFRLLPYPVSRWTLSRVNRVDLQPGIFYCHPWEIDPGQPRVVEAPLKSRFRHYLNLDATFGRLERLLRDFAWDRVDHVFAAQISEVRGEPARLRSEEPA